MKNAHPMFDVIVIGSGPAGIHAALPLIKAGLRVAIIDGGLEGDAKDIIARTNKLLKIKSNIPIVQGLGKGGLSQVWPGICDFFTDQEMEKIGLNTSEMAEEYKKISKLIKLKLYPPISNHCQYLLASYKQSYQLPIAPEYRTSNIIEKFKKLSNFTYIPNQLAFRVHDKKNGVLVRCVSLDKSSKSDFLARYLILAAGSINTTRILLRSFDLYNQKVPFLTKSNYMFICLQIKSLLKKERFNPANIGQTAISNDNFFIQFYRFNPKALNKALTYIPLPKKLVSFVFSILGPYLIIADTRFTTVESDKRYSLLKKIKVDKDVLEIFFNQNDKELNYQKEQLKQIGRSFLLKGLLTVKIIKGDVTSHYAGGIPFNQKKAKLSADSSGRLYQAKRIYIADSSTWQTLPGKPPTLTIIANASRIGKKVLKNFI